MLNTMSPQPPYCGYLCSMYQYLPCVTMTALVMAEEIMLLLTSVMCSTLHNNYWLKLERVVLF